MKHVLFRTISLTVIIMMAISLTSPAANVKNDQRKHRALRGNVDVSRVLAYSFTDEKGRAGLGASVESPRLPVGSISMANSSVSPGVVIGYTWYDHQQNGSMGRMIEAGPHSGQTGPTVVHMGWMYLPSKKMDDRSYAYNAFFSQSNSLAGQTILMTEDEYGGYVNVDVTPDNRAIVGGHNDAGAGYAPEFRYQTATGWGIWRVPDSVQNYAQDYAEYALWPKFFYQTGTDTVLHVAAQISELNENYQAIMYFRGSGANWDYPPYVVDSVQVIAQDISGVRNGNRVVLSWLAGLPYQEPWCNTCSGISVYDGYLIGQMDNDVYYQESFDQGSTWQPRVNLTKCPIGGECKKAYADLSLLIDSHNDLHIVWTACPWPADLCWDEGGFCWTEDWYVDNARLMHWSDNVPYVRPIADQVYEVQSQLWDSCWAGVWSLRIAKPTISECDGNLYTIWTQFNNPKEGLIDDCANWGYDGDPTGAANGDIWFSVSSDWGMTWSYQLNLTASYTPRCDPKFADECQSDYWASMSRYGRQVQVGENWSGAYVLDPTGGIYNGDHYLDVQYVNDLDAGGIVQGEGTWTNNPMKWFRMPCVEYGFATFCPSVSPVAVWKSIYDFEDEDIPVTIENFSATELSYTVVVEQDNGPANWLVVSGLDGTLGAVPDNIDEGTIHLNQNHVITSSGYYTGRVIMDFPQVPCADTIGVTLLVSTQPYIYDTLHTTCVELIVSNNANMGKAGAGTLNMDYYPEDCDTTAKIYMYEGSPVIGRIIDGDTICSYSMWGITWMDEEGLRPQGSAMLTTYCAQIDAEVFKSSPLTTQDSAIAIERIWVAPQSECNFIIEYTRMWSWDSQPHENIIIGEAIDWDVPWDFRVDDIYRRFSCVNMGGIDGSRNLIYQQGYDAHGLGSDTLYPYNCQFNDERFAGTAFVESHLNGSPRSLYSYGGFVATNDSLLESNGFISERLYQEMMVVGFRSTDSVKDLTSVLTYEAGLNLGAADIYEAVSVIATIKQGTLTDLQATIDEAKVWYSSKGGMSIFIDADNNGQIDVCESCCVMMGKFYNDGQPYSILDLDNWIEWMYRNDGSTAGPDCPEQLDIYGGDTCIVAGMDSFGFPICIYPDGQIDILDLSTWLDCLLSMSGRCPTECP